MTLLDIALYASSGIAGFLLGDFTVRNRQIERDCETWDIRQHHATLAFDAAERVLAFEETPQRVRLVLLALLRSIYSPSDADVLMSPVPESARASNRPPLDPSEGQLDQFRRDHPEFAEDIELALVGLTSIIIEMDRKQAKPRLFAKRPEPILPETVMRRTSSVLWPGVHSPA
ncbi:hypothetical protein [Antarcticirhabdus aurantiaca]|uniref:Uncharacterized protein n=1 Tax=Antarcticirhabdus aurantiaca TaxID=2606717 RepID=A0ACD4NLM3_9HYPH|nr:hypothetical protein OXU80_22445 [Jeongeuplla avenae]